MDILESIWEGLRHPNYLYTDPPPPIVCPPGPPPGGYIPERPGRGEAPLPLRRINIVATGPKMTSKRSLKSSREGLGRGLGSHLA